MATFEIATPDGKVYEIEAPDGTSDAQAYQYLQQSFGETKSQPSQNAYVPLAERARQEREAPEQAEDTSFARDVGDVATSFVSGIPKAAGALTSIGSLVPGLHYVADPLSAWLQEAGQGIDEALLSDRQKEINQELSDRLKAVAGELGPDAEIGEYVDAMVAQGGEAGSFIADHPGQVVNLVASSLPYIFGGGAATKGIKAGAEVLGLKSVANMGGLTGAAVGEGTITAGEVTKNIIEKTDSSGEYSTDRLAAIPAGIGTAAISLVSGRMANKAGVADIDVAITNKVAGTSTDIMENVSKKGLVSKTVSGAAREGAEEFVQGGQEKVFENVGTGEHPLTDVGGDAVMGMAAGTGQGAGVNLALGLKNNSQDELSEASAEAQEGILIAKKKEEMDAQFIAEANAIESTADLDQFAENWGMTVEEVLADPKFGLVQQEKAAAAQEENTKEQRRKHADTFPDEEIWYKENQAETLERQRIDIADEQSELGSAFINWQKDNDIYDKNDKVVKQFLDDYLTPEDVQVERGSYLQALDEHAQLKEVQASRVPEEQEQLNVATGLLLAERAEAVKTGDMEALRLVEQTATETLQPAEWREAKRAEATKTKGLKTPKAAPKLDKIDTNVIPEVATTEPLVAAETNTPPVVEPVNAKADAKPLRVTKKSQARDRAAAALGEDFEANHPELSQALEEGGIYPKRKGAQSKFDKLLDAAIRENDEINTGENLPESAPVIEGDASAAAIFSGESTENIKYSDNQKKVLQVLAEAAQTGNLDEYVSGKGVWSTQRIQGEAGLNSRQATTVAINQIKKKITAHWGEEKLANVLSGISKKARASSKDTGDSKATMADSIKDGGMVATVDGEAIDVQADASESLDPTEYLGGERETASMGVVKSAQDSQIGLDAPKTKAEKEWVEKNAEKADPVALRRQQAAQKNRLETVQKVFKDKNAMSQISKMWDDYEGNTVSFEDLSIENQSEWILSVMGAVDANNFSELTQEQEEIVTQHLGALDDKGNTGTTLESEKVAQRPSERTTGAREDGRSTNETRAESTEKVRKEKVKPKESKPKSKDTSVKNKKPPLGNIEKEAVKYANENLGEEWVFDHPQLLDMLKQKKFVAFNKETTKLSKDATKESIGSKGTGAKQKTFGRILNTLFGSKGTGAKQKTFDRILNNLFEGKVPAKAKSRIHYYDTLEDFEADGKFPDAKVTSPTVEGIHHKDNVIFILDNIAEGSELSIFMHEVGSHIGLDGLMSVAEAVKMADLIEGWATGKIDTDGRTKRIADEAVNGVVYAIEKYIEKHGKPMPKQQIRSEVIAYFVEEAVKNNIKPTPTTKAGKLLNQVMDSFRKALNNFLGFVGEGGAALTMQDIVDLAYGAARVGLELGSSTEASTKESIHRPVDPKQSKKDNRKIRNAVHALFPNKGTKHYDTFAAAMQKGIDHTKSLSQFVHENREKMPSLETLYRSILDAEKTRNDIKQHVDSIAVEARNMEQTRLDAVNSFIADSTVEQKWGYDPQIDGNTVKVDPVMKARFDKLSKEEQQVVKDVFAHGHDMITRMREVAKKVKLDHKFFHAGSMKGPYAPLKRFGNYVTELKSIAYLKAENEYADKPNKINKRKLDKLKSDESHYVVSFFDTKGQATKFRDENESKYDSAVTSPRHKTGNDGRTADYKVLTKVLGAVEALKLDPIAQSSVKDLLEDMYFQSLDDTNARQAQTKREGVAGYEKNMIRSFLSHAHSEANLISQMEHGAQISAAMATAKNDTREGNREELGEIYNLMEEHYSEMFKGKETPLTDRIAALNTVYMLTSSVGYHFTNATQPMMVSIPSIAGDFGGYANVWRKMSVGYKIAKHIVSFNAKKWQAEVDISKADPKYQPMLEELQVRQLLDVGLEQDLSEFNRFKTDSATFNKLSDKASKLTHSLYQIARVVEMYNRVAPAIAAYDMALANPSKMKKMGLSPQGYAIDIVQRTQGDFSNVGAPLLIKKANNTNFRLAVQYRKYQMMMAWAYTNAFKQVFGKDVSSEERFVGARTMSYLLMHAAFFSGVKGLPAIGLIAGVFFMATGGDEPEDIERAIQRYVEDEDLAKMIARGPLSYFGIDMSTKLSQDKIFSPAPYTDFEANPGAMLEATAEIFLGPTASTASNFVRSVEYAKEGNAYRATEYALPKGIRSAMESYRLATEGYSLKNGDVVADPEDFSKFGLVLNSLGIPATDVNNIKWTRGQHFELTQWFSDEQSSIRRKYVDARNDNNREKMNDLKNDWRELQDAKTRVRPFFNDDSKALKRSSVVNLIKAPMKQKKRERKYRKQLGTN
jgi:hypothetical protein